MLLYHGTLFFFFSFLHCFLYKKKKKKKHVFLQRNLVLGDLCFLFSRINGILLYPFPGGPKLNKNSRNLVGSQNVSSQ